MTACTGGGPDGEATCPRHGEQPQHLADLEDALAEADADQQWMETRMTTPDAWNLLLTPEQRAEDPHADPLVEALAVRLYESDPESEFNAGDDVQWRDNYADRDHYRGLARVAINFLGGAR